LALNHAQPYIIGADAGARSALATGALDAIMQFATLILVLALGIPGAASAAQGEERTSAATTVLVGYESGASAADL